MLIPLDTADLERRSPRPPRSRTNLWLHVPQLRRIRHHNNNKRLRLPPSDRRRNSKNDTSNACKHSATPDNPPNAPIFVRQPHLSRKNIPTVAWLGPGMLTEIHLPRLKCLLHLLHPREIQIHFGLTPNLGSPRRSRHQNPHTDSGDERTTPPADADPDDDFHLIIDIHSPGTYLGGKGYRGFLQSGQAVFAKLWDGWKYSGKEAEKEVGIYMALQEFWARWFQSY